MNGPLQEFTPDKSNYERPTQGWSCGRKSEGHPCHIGPSSGGHCQSHLECIPAKDGDGYVCSRPPSFGGKCDKGPLPDGSCCQPPVKCHPVRSLFGRRRMFSMTVAGLALGLLLCSFGGSAAVREAVTSPGDLTLQHTSSKQNCESCHHNAGKDFNALSDSLSSTVTVAIEDSQNCLKCHDFGPDALNPHSLSASQLTAMTAKAEASGVRGSKPFFVSLANQLAGSPMDEGELACSRCHKEHRGRLFDLKQMADSQCQVCHTSTFHGFNAGHPEFSGFPYKRRTRIHFDHATHYGSHFANFKRIMPNGKAPESCETCHQPDPSHQTMPVVNFGQACGSCHGDQLNRAIDSVAFLSLPQVDVALLQQSQSRIGEWPSEVTLLTVDGELPAFTQLLLENDENWAKANQMLQMAEQDGDAAQARAQAQLVWATKSLISDLVTNGRSELERRLTAALGPSGRNPALINALTGSGAFLDRLQIASAIWFPNLQQELEQHDGDSSPEYKSVAVSGASSSVAGWNTGAGTITYLPSGHDDRTVQVLIDALVAVPRITTEAEKDDSQAARQLFSVVTDPTASFRCMTCHTVDAADGSAVVNWYGRRLTSRDRSFVRFSHSPHVTLLVQGDKSGASETASECAHCHKLGDFSNREEVFFHSQFLDIASGKANTNPHTSGTSGFDAVGRAVCAECHTQARAGESCLKCHNYHVGHFATGSSLTTGANHHSDLAAPSDGAAE